MPNRRWALVVDADVVVIGAGIAGLVAAYRVQDQGRSVIVLESEPNVGGRMATRRLDGYALDLGADGFLKGGGYRRTYGLARELGVLDSIESLGVAMGALWKDGRPHPLPPRPYGLATFTGLSWRAKRIMAAEALRLVRDRRLYNLDALEDAPVAHLTLAEYGLGVDPEIFDFALDPLVCGLWGADSTQTGASPLLTILRDARGAAIMSTYRGGMDAMARALAARVDVWRNAPVTRIEVTSKVKVWIGNRAVTAHSCISAVPGPVIARLYPEMPTRDRDYAEASTYSSLVCIGCCLDAPIQLGNFYGLTFARPERRDLAFLTFEHLKAPDRAPAGNGLVRVAASPTVSRDLMDADDEEIRSTLLPAAGKLLPDLRPHVVQTVPYRWRYALPLFPPKALRLRKAFTSRPLSRVEYAGDWVVAPSSEGAIRSAEIAARRTLKWTSR